MTDLQRRTRRRLLARLVFDPGYAGPTLDRAFAAPDELIDASSRVLKHDRTTTVARIDDCGTAWVIKRYNTKNIWHAVRRTLRTSRASNCWRMSEMFLAAGIAVPSPVGYIENRIGPLRGRSYFLYEFIDARDLLGFVKARSDPAELDFVFDGIRDLFRALRQSGINHGDMKATNILVAPDLSLRLLDLDAARRPERADLFERGYARDRARFLKNWDAEPDLRDRFGSELPA